MGFDPAKPAASAEKPFNNRLELPPDAYSANKDMFTLRGNKLNTEGRPAPVEVNQYRMKKLDLSKKIYQYDVSTPRSCPAAFAYIIRGCAVTGPD